MPLFPWLISSYPGLGAMSDGRQQPDSWSKHYPKAALPTCWDSAPGGLSSRNDTCLEQGSEESWGEAAEAGSVEQGGEQALRCLSWGENSVCCLPVSGRALQSLV